MSMWNVEVVYRYELGMMLNRKMQNKKRKKRE
jgi:hypothetical protein